MWENNINMVSYFYISATDVALCVPFEHPHFTIGNASVLAPLISFALTEVNGSSFFFNCSTTPFFQCANHFDQEWNP